MDLISCGECGVVLDRTKLDFPSEDALELEEGGVDYNKAEWSSELRNFVAKTACPCCNCDILNTQTGS